MHLSASLNILIHPSLSIVHERPSSMLYMWGGIGWDGMDGYHRSYVGLLRAPLLLKISDFSILAGYIFGETAAFLLISYPKVKLMEPLKLDVCC